MVLPVEIVMNVLGEIAKNVGFAQPQLLRPLLSDDAEVRRLQSVVPRPLKYFHQVNITGGSIQGVEPYCPECKNERLARPFAPQMCQIVHEVFFTDTYLQGRVSNRSEERRVGKARR